VSPGLGATQYMPRAQIHFILGRRAWGVVRFGRRKPAVGTGALRNTGIPLIGDTDWGTNICMFYETKDDLLETTVAYFEAGLANNELCVWAVSDPISETDAANAMREKVANYDYCLSSKSIVITSKDQWDLREDEFNLQRITRGWTTKLHQALERGYEGLRISGNASWLETNHWKEFCEYDQELDRCVAGKKMIVLCTHSRGSRHRASTSFHSLPAARRMGICKYARIGARHR
jgi:hypothetical protein